MPADEIAEALDRYARATPFGDSQRPTDAGPVERFPRLPPIARSVHPSQWAAMMRAVARLADFPGDMADVLAYEAATYLVQQSRGKK
jgi:hypothetical protein